MRNLWWVLYFSLSFFILHTNNVFSQEWIKIQPDTCNVPLKERPIIEIHRIDIKDSLLKNSIELIIEELINTDSLLKNGIGYFFLYTYKPYENKEIERQYYFKPWYASLKSAAEEGYPQYFTYIKNYIVLIRSTGFSDLACYRFSDKSKKNIRKLTEAYLADPEDATFYNMDGTVAFRDKNFRVDYLSFHNGKVITIYKNRPPEVLSEKEYEEKYYRRGY